MPIHRLFIMFALSACASDSVSDPSVPAAEVSSPTAPTVPTDEDGEVCEVDESYDPVIDPARFVETIDNPLFPLTPGTMFLYEEGDQRIEVTVTNERKTILGVSTVVVRDVVTEDGEIIEDTFDWYAQDVDGTVWYFGEATVAFEDGMSSTAGSWEAGVDGARPGIVMLAEPAVGASYRQEYFACEAEDEAEVIDACVDIEGYDNCVQTLDTTRLDPDIAEHKYYCPGVGLVLAVDLQTGDREELVEVTRPEP